MALTDPPTEATQTALRADLARIGARPFGVVAILDRDGWRLESRESRGQALRRSGDRDLARRLFTDFVPAGHVLVLVDDEAGANLLLLPIVTIFGEGDLAVAPASPTAYGHARRQRERSRRAVADEKATKRAARRVEKRAKSNDQHRS